MRPRFRLWFVLLLVLTLPLRGYASNAMQCALGGPVSEQTMVHNAHSAHDHQPISEHSTVTASESEGPGVAAQTHGHHTCSICCCAAAIATAQFLWVPIATAPAEPPDSGPLAVVLVSLRGLERPPRSRIA